MNVALYRSIALSSKARASRVATTEQGVQIGITIQQVPQDLHASAIGQDGITKDQIKLAIVSIIQFKSSLGTSCRLHLVTLSLEGLGHEGQVTGLILNR